LNPRETEFGTNGIRREGHSERKILREMALREVDTEMGSAIDKSCNEIRDKRILERFGIDVEIYLHVVILLNC